MEVYKFYINSLYVAITRAIKSVYLIEKNPHHPLMSLLNINEINQTIQLDIAESSIDEWQKEASRLASQGKAEQATAINEIILKQKTPPWAVIDKKAYLQLLDNVLVGNLKDKKGQLELFEVAMLYGDQATLDTLKDQGFRPATNIKRSYPIMYDKHLQKYTIKNSTAVLKEIQTYGVDHRTVMNFTPLMSAIYAGNINLVHQILEMGPSLELKDSLNRNPLQLAIFQTVFSEKNLAPMLASIYHRIALDSISLNIDEHLVKIDASRAEYLLFNIVLTFYAYMIHFQIKGYSNHWNMGFNAQQIFQLVKKLPPSIWPDYRKKQSYLSSLLSRNEINSNYRPNRKLFKRLSRGYYIINPNLKIKTSSGWESTNPYALPLNISDSSTDYIDKVTIWSEWF
jgi:ankyrin repeat protein